jgi:O-antigen biosynthesis protein
MTESPNAVEAANPYDANYYATYCGGTYERNDHWLSFFAMIADRLAADIAPRVTLDAGCAFGFLVEALRDRGVEAYGVDISEYAIEQARDDIRPYLRCGSLTEPFSRRYDLITCIEVLEHMPAAEAEAAVANICGHTDDVIFTSTPNEYAEATHINVRPPEYWGEVFARHGFFRDVDFDPTFIAGWAVRFVRLEAPIHRVVKGYERAYARLQEENQSRRQGIVERDAAIARMTAERDALRAELDRLRAEQAPLRADVRRLSTDLSYSENLLVTMEGQLREMRTELDHLRAMTGSVTWRASERVQQRLRRLAPTGSRRSDVIHRAAATLADEGARGLVKRSTRKAARLVRSSPPQPDAETTEPELNEATTQYRNWLSRHVPGTVELRRQQAVSEAWATRPLVSIVMPVFNSQPGWLEDAVNSVLAQSYSNWELCIADDASTVPAVRETLERMGAGDPRIKIVYRSDNGGISAASNSAMAVATGDYVGLLDHDDVLAPHALFTMVQHLLDHPDHGLVYSDEDKILVDGGRGDPFFKPDWSPDLMLSVNYVCHFTVMRRDAVERAGGFVAGYDGAQDYDLFLRVIDLGVAVGHIADVLYSWRMSPQSTAFAGAAKPQAVDAGRRAVAASLERRNVDARVMAARVPGRQQVRYRIAGEPLVSIVIPTRDRADLLRTCINSITSKSTYRNYEIVIVDNDSRDGDARAYLDSCGHQVVPYPEHFNYSRAVNLGAASSRGEHILLLNNDVEVIQPEWIEALLEHAQRPQVGAVGARLLYPDGRPQHEGISVGLGFIAGNIDHGHYFELGMTTSDVTGVTGACMMIPRTVYEEIGGFDEGLRVAFNDVDFCLRLRRAGYWIVYEPLAELYHHESASRGRLHPMEDEGFFIERWGTWETLHDPFVNANVQAFNPLRLRP